MPSVSAGHIRLICSLLCFLSAGWALCHAQDKPQARKNKKGNYSVDRMVDSSKIESTLENIQELMLTMLMVGDLAEPEELLEEEEDQAGTKDDGNNRRNRRTKRNRNRNRNRRTNSDRRLTRNRVRYRRADTQDDIPLA